MNMATYKEREAAFVERITQLAKDYNEVARDNRYMSLRTSELLCELAETKELVERLEQERNADIEAYNAALEFALEALDSTYDTILFLRLWREGCWPEIEDQFPEFDLGTAAPCGYMAVSEQIEGE